MRNTRSNTRSNTRRNILIIAGACLAILLIVYIGFSFYFKNHFIFKTEMNGINVGGMTILEAEQEIADEVADYLLTIYDRDGNKCHVQGSDVECAYIADGGVGKLLEEQDPFLWIFTVFRLEEKETQVKMTYSKERLDQVVQNLPLFQEDQLIVPANAFIQQVDGIFQLVPEVAGNQLKLELVIESVEDAINRGTTEITLEDTHYENPAITSKSEAIASCMAQLEQYQNLKITYDVGGGEEVVDRFIITGFLTVGEDFSITISKEKIDTYVQKLASKYNTYGDVRKFKTSSGDTVDIGGGDYGWVIDKKAEAEQLLADIQKGESLKREPMFSQRALFPGIEDIGNTYLEIDYGKQHLWYYEEGVLIVEMDIVSGNISKNNGSPDGVFKIVYKKSPDVLRGETYESNVTYFMPYAYNVGVHDASWRSKFGGDEYKTAGSHGCINAPEAAVAKLYERIKVGTPVIAFYREKVELTAENTRISNAFSYVKPEKEVTTP